MSSYTVKQIVVPPEHYFMTYASWSNDIALIELTQPVPDYIKAAPIPDVGVELRKCKSAGEKDLQEGPSRTEFHGWFTSLSKPNFTGGLRERDKIRTKSFGQRFVIIIFFFAE